MLSLFLTNNLQKFISTIIISFSIFLGTVFFYEGFQLLNWWPANKIPVYGWIVEGEIKRRSKPLIDLAVLNERALWKEARNKALIERNKIIQEKNTRISEIISDNFKKQIEFRKENNEVVETLLKSIDESNQETSDEKINTNPLRMRIPTRVYNNIR